MLILSHSDILHYFGASLIYAYLDQGSYFSMEYATLHISMQLMALLQVFQIMFLLGIMFSHINLFPLVYQDPTVLKTLNQMMA